MCLAARLKAVMVMLVLSATLQGADVILNEYNAVEGNAFLGGGDAAADGSQGRACDSYFGRVEGNGGDWFELVVITDHLDMRGWHLDIFEGGALDETLNLTDHEVWADLRAGTVITVAEDVASDISYNPAAGDWWINVQANDDAEAEYIEASSFPVSSDDWQLRIRDGGGVIVYGPAGEGISPDSGVGATEVFRLERDPDAFVVPGAKDYDDGDDFSTFGAANRWGKQNFEELRTVDPLPASLALLSPNGLEVLATGDFMTIRWDSEGVVEAVLVEFSVDGGGTWSRVYPPNVGNRGQYRWLVPAVDSDECLVRVSSTTRPAVHDVSDATFTIFQCPIAADLTGDCIVNFFDLAVMASFWAQ